MVNSTTAGAIVSCIWRLVVDEEQKIKKEEIRDGKCGQTVRVYAKGYVFQAKRV